MPNEFVARNGVISLSNSQITGSLNVSSGITGSLFGTASWASNSVSAAYATSSSYSATASYALNAQGSGFPYTGSAVITGSLIITGSILSTQGFTGSLWGTSSWSNNANTASYATNSVSSSFSSTASYAISALTSSFSISATTSSYAFNANSASFASTSSLPLRGVITASVVGSTITFTKGDSSTFNITIATATADTASYVTSSNVDGPLGKNSVLSSSFALTASYVINAVSSSFASQALTASYVANAVSSSFAATSSNVLGGSSNYIPIWSRATSLSSSVIYQSGSSIGIGTTTPSDTLTISDPVTSTFSLRLSGSTDALVFTHNSSISTINSYNNHLTVGAAGPSTTSQEYISFTKDSHIVAIGVNSAEKIRIDTASTSISGSLTVTQGITGSLFGTSSWANNSISSSYSVSSSFSTKSLTSSYADNFTVAGTLTAQTIVVQTITSSIDYVTGSTRFGSLQSNTHAFTGSVSISGSLRVVGAGITGSLFGTSSWATNALTASSADSFVVRQSLTASGLVYPTADNGVGSFIQTDGTGNLSLQYVKTIYEQIYNGESTTIAKGTPLYVSGSVGANAVVYRADAAIVSKMPVIYVSADNIAAASTGRGIALGLITGVDTTGYPVGTEVYVAPGGGWTSTRPTGSAIVQVLGYVTKEGSGGQGVVLNPGPANLPNLAPGNVWMGDSTSFPVAISTSSLYVDNALTSSNVQGGTINYVPLWNGVTSLSSSVIYQSGSNVGIRNTSPSSELQISSNNPYLTLDGNDSSYTNAGVLLIAKGTANARGLGMFMFQSASQVEWFAGQPYQNGDSFVINRRASATSSLGTVPRGLTANNSYNLVFVSSSGNVGIGTTTPTEKLRVVGTIRGDVTRSETHSQFQYWYPAYGYMSTTNATPTDYATLLNGTMYFRPFSVSQVSGLGSFGWTLGVHDVNNGYGYSWQMLSDFSGNIALRAASSSTTWKSPYMIWKDGGNVGIGTTTPNARLDVNGNAIITGSLTVTDTITAQTLVVQTITSSISYVTGSTRFGSLQNNTHAFTGSVNITGSLTINTNNPVLSLDDNDSTVRYAGIRFGTNGGNWFASSGDNTTVSNNDFWITRTSNGSDNRVKIARDTYSLSVYTGSNENIRLNATGSTYFNGGNVGIGTTTPTAKLDISSDLTSDYTSAVRLRNPVAGTTFTNVAIEFWDRSTTINSAVVGTRGNIGGHWGGDLSLRANQINSPQTDPASLTEMIRLKGYEKEIRFSPSGSELVRFTSASVGIGTINPIAKLHVKRASSEIPLILDTSNDGSSSYTQYRVNNSTGWEVGMAGNTDNYKYFFSYGTFGSATAKLAISSSGNVGIGTATPADRLQIAGGNIQMANTYGVIWPSSAGSLKNSSSITTLSGYSGLTMYTAVSTSDIVFQNNETGTHVTIKGNTGNVGIGTTSPSSKLYVNGTATIFSTLSMYSGYTSLDANFSGSAILTIGNVSGSGIGGESQIKFTHNQGSAGGKISSIREGTYASGPERNSGLYFYTANTGADVLRLFISSSGATIVSGSLTVTQGITGSMFGTSSWSNNALTSSYVNTLNQGVVISGSLSISGSVVSYVTYNTQTTNYTIALSDVNDIVEMNSASTITVTVPSSSVVNFPIGSQIIVAGYGTGQVTFTTGSTGVILRSAGSRYKLTQQYSVATLAKRGTDEWYLFGDLSL